MFYKPAVSLVQSGFSILFQIKPQMKPPHQSSGAPKRQTQAIIIRSVIFHLRVIPLI